ncbi:MAG: glutathionylspermidine synthase family protein [Hyphomicrobiaceae bacterium]
MERRLVPERRDWRDTARDFGFDFHSPDGTVYWEERHCYVFTLDEIETGLEEPALEIEDMCSQIVARAVRDDEILTRLKVPQPFWGYVARSWEARERQLYGRMDFCFDGTSPAKLYEYNADTPTSLFESAVFQWTWLEQRRERGVLGTQTDQFNSIHERLVGAWSQFGLTGPLHLAATGESIEDIGISDDGRFTDAQDRVIQSLFKLYPWEWLLTETFAQHIPASGCQFIEPAWKTVLSNKGLMALLWDQFPGHPNLLPCYFDGDPRAADLGDRYVRKPLYSREGANIDLVLGRRRRNRPAAGPYGAEGHVVQAYHPLPRFQGRRPVCGVWVVAGQPAGLGVREGDDDVTTDAARFVPHAIMG